MKADAMNNKKGKMYIWGTGHYAEKIYTQYSELFGEIGLDGFIDNDIRQHGNTFHGVLIYPPSILNSVDDCYIFIATYKKEEILDQIRKEYYQHYDSILEDSYYYKIKLMERYRDSEDTEIQRIMRYLENHRLDFFNYEFKEKYYDINIPIYLENDMYFVIRRGKKMYFTEDFTTEKQVRDYYISLLIEQDEESPHKYTDQTFDVDEGSVLVDAGAAEGMFALDIIDKCRKVYLFEPDEKWCKALQKTFENYDDKVIIANKSISDYSNSVTTKLDDMIKDDSVDFIKMDIEGEELYALQGAKELIERSPGIKCSVCTYHQEFAYYAIKDFLERAGFNVSHSNGYMWYVGQFNELRAPVLRRGLIRASRFPKGADV